MKLSSKNFPISEKWKTLFFLAIAELLGMAVWFSASAVVPALTQAWALDDAGKAWLTISVQIGFVIGSFGSAVFNLADRIPSKNFFSVSSFMAGLSTALIPVLANGINVAILFRCISGVFLAGVYPVGMKIMATWTKEDRGLGIGLLVGALTLGSATPHLINAFGGVQTWQNVLYVASILAFIGGILAILFVSEGPNKTITPPFNWRYIGLILRKKDIVFANLGYLGHMWELYAMWAWIPVFLQSSFRISGISSSWASFWSFATIGIGGMGSAIAGNLADHFGRTKITKVSLLISGSISLIIGLFYGKNPLFVIIIALFWGFSVVADSAQFSACISELADQKYIGTALTLQTSLGFLLTLITIRLIPTLEGWLGWKWAFAFLSLGPIVGFFAMDRLKNLPSASKLAGGKG